MRGLDNEKNPYRGEYEEWDYWAFCSGHPASSGEEAQIKTRMLPQSWLGVYVLVDSAGYPIPIASREEIKYCGTIRSVGPAPLGIKRGVAEARLREYHQETYEELPDWLAASPPLMVKTMPDGEFLVLGELGRGPEYYVRLGGFPELAGNLPVYRYDSAGNILDTCRAGKYWRCLYWTEYLEAWQRYEEDPELRLVYGPTFYLVVTDDADRTVVRELALDGTPVDRSVPGEDSLFWSHDFYGLELTLLHEQRHAGE